MIKKIFKGILAYTIFYILDIFIFSCLLYKYRYNVNLIFTDYLYYQFVNGYVEINRNIITGVVCFIQNIMEVSAAAILSGYMFAYILNQEPKIIFPDKLVIRYKTSQEAKDKITLGVLIGNRSNYNIHNVICSITCSYIKQEEPLLINSEFTLAEERILLENYYRFSFDLSKFPKQILEDIIKKPMYYKDETIVVSITGNCNYIGNSFRVFQKYNLSDIVYDQHEPVILYTRKNRFTGKELVNPFNKKIIKRMDWNELKKIIEVDEDRRSIFVNEIKYIIRGKQKD